MTLLPKGKEIKIPGPDHPIAILPVKGRVRVAVAGRIVAESTRALLLEEKGYPSVYYLPREDADIHDKSLSSGARMSVGALESACLYLGSVISSRLSLSAGFLRNAEPEIHSLYRVLRTVTED